MLSSHELYFVIYGALALFVLGIVLSYLARAKQDQGNDLVERLEKALPGAQCAQCGFPGCRAYAEALAAGTASCNKCTPGGVSTTEALAEILGVSANIEDNEDAIFTPRTVAFIHKTLCTGCGKCQRYCPVDAIEGTHHTPHVILEEECIGCGDCVKACPEECIEMIRQEQTLAHFNWDLQAIRFQGTGASK